MPYPDGRPQLVTKPAGCTPEVTARFAAIMASGCYMETACAMLGITRSVAYFWFSEGESAVQELGLETIALPAENPDEPPRLDPAALAQFTERDQPYVRFWFEVSRAMAKAELHALSLIRDAAIPKTKDQRGGKTGGEWTAAAWFLERRRPEQWGRRQFDHNVNHSGTVEIVPVFGAEDPLRGGEHHDPDADDSGGNGSDS